MDVHRFLPMQRQEIEEKEHFILIKLLAWIVEATSCSINGTMLR